MSLPVLAFFLMQLSANMELFIPLKYTCIYYTAAKFTCQTLLYLDISMLESCSVFVKFTPKQNLNCDFQNKDTDFPLYGTYFCLR